MDRASLRSETEYARRYISKGIGTIRVKVLVDRVSFRREAQAAGRIAGSAATAGFNQAFRAAPTSFAQQFAAAGMMRGNPPLTGGGGPGVLGGRQFLGGGRRGGAVPFGGMARRGQFRGLRSSGLGAFAQGFGFQFAPAMTAAGFFGGPAGAAGAAAGIGIGAAGGAAVDAMKTFADFEHAMTRVKIVQQEAGANAGQIKMLEDQARQLGRTTIFSATEAANAMVVLSQRGFDANEVYAQMPNVLGLAAAGQMDVAEAAAVVGSAMKQFGLDAKSSQRIIDVLAKASLDSATDVHKLGTALSYVGPIANLSGEDLERTAAALMLLADAGIDASKSGRALRTLLGSLSTEKVQKSFAGIGIDIRGKNLQQILRDSRDRLSRMDQPSQMEFFSRTFEQNAKTAFAALIEQGPEAYAEALEKLAGAEGTAGRVHEAMISDMLGQMERLTSALDELKIRFGDAFGDDVTRMITKTSDALGGLAIVLDAVQNNKSGQDAKDFRAKHGMGWVDPMMKSLMPGSTLLAVFDALGIVGREENRAEAFKQQLEQEKGMDKRARRAGQAAGVARLGGVPGIGAAVGLGIPGLEEAVKQGIDRRHRIQMDLWGPEVFGGGPIDVQAKNRIAERERSDRRGMSGFVGIEELSRKIQEGLLQKKDPTQEHIKQNTKNTIDAVDRATEAIKNMETYGTLA